MRNPRRLAALGVVALGLGLAAAADGNPAHRPRGSGASAFSSLSDAVSVGGAASSAWYCAGPLPIGARATRSSLVVANMGAKRLTGTVSVALSTGGTRDAMITVPAGGSRTVQLPATGRPGYAAATVEMDGAGLGVQELTAGPGTVATSPCVVQLRRQAYFPAGSTLGGRDLTLALYNPTATPAVADVTFALGMSGTSTSQAAPAAFQGVPVGAGQVVELDVGRQVPEHGLVATTVSVSGGHVVAGLLATVPQSARATTAALVEGSSDRTDRWMFGATARAASSDRIYSVLDPGPRSTTARLVIGSGPKRSSIVLPVPAGGAATVQVPSSIAPGQLVSITTAKGVQVTVARTTTVPTAAAVAAAARAGGRAGSSRTSSIGATAAIARARRIAAQQVASQVAAAEGAVTPAEIKAVTVNPDFGAGTSTSPGVVRPWRRWLLAGGASSRRLGEVVTVVNPGSSAVRFSLFRLANSGTVAVGAPGSGPVPSQPGGSSGGVSRLAIPAEHVATLRVPAEGSVSVDVDYLLGEPGPLSLVVSATRPVIAGEVLYARGSSRSTGFANVDGIPVG